MTDIRDTLNDGKTLDQLMGEGIAEALLKIAVLSGRVDLLDRRLAVIESRSIPPASGTAEVNLSNGTRVRGGTGAILALAAMALVAFISWLLLG